MNARLLFALFLIGCAHKNGPPPVDLSAGGKLHVVPVEGGQVYLIDPKTETCFLFLPPATPIGEVNCHKLKAGVPAAEKYVTWPDESFTAMLREAQSILAAPIDEPPASKEPEESATGGSIEGVTRTGKGRYELKQSLIDRVLEDPATVAKGARIVPSVRDGKPNGFKFYAIRPDSFFATLGILNGDTVTSINGMELTSADKALEVYTKLRESKKWEVVLQRKGKQTKHTYTIK